MIDVIVVGAGPTGLTLAIELRRRDIDVRVIEALATPLKASKGKGLQPRTLEVFDDLGVINEVLGSGGPYPAIRIYAPGTNTVVSEQRMHALVAPSSAVPYPNIVMLPQWRTEEILTARLEALGGRVERGIGLAGLIQDETGVLATLVDGTTIAARYIVGADGGHSAVRRAAGIELIGDTPTLERIAVADVEATGVDRDYWHGWATGPGNFIGLCPLPGSNTFQMTVALPSDATPDFTLAFLQQQLNERSGRTDIRLSNLGWTSLYRPNIRMADRYRQGRVFIAGDAAHIHPPAGGQGLNTGVQDAYNLGWKLAAVLGGAPETLLDSYEEERLPIAAHVLGVSEKLLRAGLAGNPDALKRSEDERQLSLTYRGSSLCGGSGRGELQPGDRMPDGVLEDGRRIFDVLREPAWHVLEIGGEVVAVRPDTYVGGIFATRAEADAYVRQLSR